MKIKHLTLFATLLFVVEAMFAQIPAGYYDSATGSGATLKTQLYNIINGHTSVSYDQLWTSFQTTDKKSNGKVWDMYTNCDFTFGTQQDGGSGGTAECQYYNREHSFPKSWFGGSVAPMYTDLFHLIPTDKYVNNARGNYCFGKVTSATLTFSNGGKIGQNTSGSFTGIVYEPADEYKGDLARSYFYMATRYENIVASWENNDVNGNALLNGTSYPSFEPWAIALLINWSTQDTVSQKEINRNNAIYGIQHNRNPYIDHPEWVSAVWGAPVAVTSVVVNSAGDVTSIAIPAGTLQMSATIAPANATNQNVTWLVVPGTGSATISSTGLLTAVTNGDVTVKATANDGSGVFGTKIITISNQVVSVDSYQNSSNISFYPNPVENVLTIDMSATTSLPSLVWISDVTGKIIFQTAPTTTKLDIDMTNVNKGIYFLNLNSAQNKITYKLVR